MQKALLEKNSFVKKRNHFAMQLSKSKTHPPQYRPKIGGTEGGDEGKRLFYIIEKINY